MFIENVGNLVCPALFDLGERERVVIASVTEGADKPLKYPTMFHSASLVILNKIDLSPYVDFDHAEFDRALSIVSHHAEVLRLSATTGVGIERWYSWLRERRRVHPTAQAYSASVRVSDRRGHGDAQKERPRRLT